MDFKESQKELDDLSIPKNLESNKSRDTSYNDIISILHKHPDKRVVKIFEKRYCPNSRKPPTWRNISKDFDLSSQTIINLHTKGIKYLRKKIKNFT